MPGPLSQLWAGFRAVVWAELLISAAFPIQSCTEPLCAVTWLSPTEVSELRMTDLSTSSQIAQVSSAHSSVPEEFAKPKPYGFASHAWRPQCFPAQSTPNTIWGCNGSPSSSHSSTNTQIPSGLGRGISEHSPTAALLGIPEFWGIITEVLQAATCNGTEHTQGQFQTWFQIQHSVLSNPGGSSLCKMKTRS